MEIDYTRCYRNPKCLNTTGPNSYINIYMQQPATFFTFPISKEL